VQWGTFSPRKRPSVRSNEIWFSEKSLSSIGMGIGMGRQYLDNELMNELIKLFIN
jgi:hypothetical protein